MEFENNFEINENDDFQYDFQENHCNGTIFLIDCRSTLFTRNLKSPKNSIETSWFEMIIDGCISVAKNKALNFGKDTLSIVFYRVAKSSDVIMKNVFVFQNLEVTSIECIHKLMKLKSLTAQQFNEQYGFSDEVSLFHGLWCCQHLFSKCKLKLGSKQILLFTDDDDPHRGNDDLKRRIFVKGRDLQQTDTHIELIPLTTANGFNADKFYRTLLLSNLNDANEESLSINDPVSVIDELMTRIRHKQYKKRKLTTVKWQLGSEQLGISVAVYSLIRKTPPPTFVRLDRDTNTEVFSKSATFLKEKDQMLMPFDMKYSLTIAYKTICFEPEEVNKIRSIIDPGIRLLGFKDMKYLKRHYQIRASQFIYPDESIVEGSVNLFSALLIRCSQRNLFALCVYVPRKATQIRFVALVPQLEKLDDSFNQIRQPGFHVVFLPFSEDIRQLNLPPPIQVSDSDKDMCKKLIKTLALEYDPETILNPVLQKKLAFIEAMALNLDIPDNVEDHTVIDCEDINTHCGEFLREFKEHFRLDEQQAISSPKSMSTKGPIDIAQLYQSGKLNSQTIPVLKAEANKLGIKLTGSKKGDIVDSIVAYFDKNG